MPAGSYRRGGHNRRSPFWSGDKHFCAGLPYTDNEDFKAIAKTITIGPDKNPVASAIVLRESILGGAHQAFTKEYPDRTADEQRLIYVIWHEVAHALDATRRQEDKERPKSVCGDDRRFKVAHVSLFFCGVVLSEIHACRFSACAWSPHLAELEAKSNSDSCERMITRAFGEIRSYSGDQLHLKKIAFMTAQALWVPFFHFGNTFAHMAGNRELPRELTIWPNAPEGTEAIIHDYAALLNEVFDSYPKTPDTFDERLSGFWQRLCGLYKVRFAEVPGSGDGIFWNA